MEPRFVDLLDRLASAKVDFVVIGGIAANLHGSCYTTTDVDVCIAMTPQNLQRCSDCLQPLNPHFRQHPSRPRWVYRLGEKWNNVYLSTDLGQLDLLGEVAGIGGYAEVERQTIVIDTGKNHIQVLSPEALVRAKEAAGRPKDLLVAAELRGLHGLDG